MGLLPITVRTVGLEWKIEGESQIPAQEPLTIPVPLIDATLATELKHGDYVVGEVTFADIARKWAWNRRFNSSPTLRLKEAAEFGHGQAGGQYGCGHPRGCQRMTFESATVANPVAIPELTPDVRWITAGQSRGPYGI